MMHSPDEDGGGYLRKHAHLLNCCGQQQQQHILRQQQDLLDRNPYYRHNKKSLSRDPEALPASIVSLSSSSSSSTLLSPSRKGEKPPVESQWTLPMATSTATTKSDDVSSSSSSLSPPSDENLGIRRQGNEKSLQEGALSTGQLHQYMVYPTKRTMMAAAPNEDGTTTENEPTPSRTNKSGVVVNGKMMKYKRNDLRLAIPQLEPVNLSTKLDAVARETPRVVTPFSQQQPSEEEASSPVAATTLSQVALASFAHLANVQIFLSKHSEVVNKIKAKDTKKKDGEKGEGTKSMDELDVKKNDEAAKDVDDAPRCSAHVEGRLFPPLNQILSEHQQHQQQNDGPRSFPHHKTSSSSRIIGITTTTITSAVAEQVRMTKRTISSLIQTNPMWLEGILDELLHRIPVGDLFDSVLITKYHLISSLVEVLCHGCPGSHHAVSMACSLLDRLLSEEDALRTTGNGKTLLVSSSLYATVQAALVHDQSTGHEPSKAEELLRQIRTRYAVAGGCSPRTIHYTLVLNGWCRHVPMSPSETGKGEPSSHQHSLAADQKQRQRHEAMRFLEEEMEPNIVMNVHMYNAVLNVLVRRGALEDAEELLLRLERNLADVESSSYPHRLVLPNTKSYCIVMEGWQNKSYHRCLALLERMDASILASHRHVRGEGGILCVEAILCVMRSLVHANSHSDYEAGPAAAHYMDQLWSFQNGKPRCPSIFSNPTLAKQVVHVTMEAWAKSGQPRKVKELLDFMRSTHNVARPCRVSYTLLIRAHCKAGETTKAADVVRQLASGHSGSGVRPTTEMCNVVLKSWVNDALHCRRFFDWIWAQAYQDRGSPVAKKRQVGSPGSISSTAAGSATMKPDTETFRWVLESLRKDAIDRGQRRSSLHAVHVVQRWISVAWDLGPSLDLHLIALQAMTWSPPRQVSFLDYLEEQAVSRDDSHGKPTLLSLECYHAVLIACTNVADATTIFHRMTYKMKLRPTTLSYNTMMVHWAKSMRHDAFWTVEAILERMDHESLQPDADSYNFALASCLTSRYEVEAAEVAQRIMIRLHSAYRDGDRTMVPSANAAQTLFGRVHQHRGQLFVSILEDLLGRIQRFHGPFADAYFGFGLLVCSLSSNLDAPRVAGLVWKQIDRPSLWEFNLLLKTYACHGLPEKAEVVMDQIKGQYAQLEWKPNELSFEYLLGAWARSKRTGGAERTFQLLEQERHAGQIEVTASAVAQVLLACFTAPAVDPGKKLFQYKLAFSVFERLADWDLTPTSLHYNRLLQCAIYCAPNMEARTTMTTTVFRLACRDGFVDSVLLMRYWACSTDETRKLVFGDVSSLSTTWKLPPSNGDTLDTKTLTTNRNSSSTAIATMSAGSNNKSKRKAMSSTTENKGIGRTSLRKQQQQQQQQKQQQPIKLEDLPIRWRRNNGRSLYRHHN